jgi:hypothetical protein
MYVLAGSGMVGAKEIAKEMRKGWFGKGEDVENETR